MREGDAGNVEILLAEIRAQLRDLAARVSRLENQHEVGQALPKTTVATMEQAPPSARAVLSEDRLIAISAAVAAFLGERVRIRQIRLIRSNAWAQQGRVSVQASHWLHR
jgi:methylmalonyl-CoA carboxyltransferase 12S subunit